MSNTSMAKMRRGVIVGVAIATIAVWTSSVDASSSRSGGAIASAEAPAMGGHITVSGDAEVSNPWTPSAMRCDSYCYTRARTFFDQVAVFGEDGQVHGMLAESIEPNDDYTEWTITIREDISFTDGTPVNAAAVIYNLQATGTGVLVGALVKDIAKIPDPADPERMILKIEQLDDLSFVIYTGDDGAPDKPLPWRNFPHTLTGQWGLIASPFWLAEVAENPEAGDRAGRIRTVCRRQL